MANWKRVLISGSHFTVKELKISNIGTAQDGDTILFAGSASAVDSGSFKAESKFVLADGKLSASYGTNSGQETSFEGDGSGITGIDSANAEAGIKHGAGVGIINASNQNAEFTANNAGVFTIALKGASNFPTVYGSEVNTQTAVNSKNAGVNGGILFATHSAQNKLILDPDLPGNGLEWDPSYLNGGIGNKLRVDLDALSGGDSGLTRGSSGLKLSTNLDGDGIDLTNGVLKIDLASNSGLTTSDGVMGTGELSLVSSLAGTGLVFAAVNDRSVINIDTSVVVTNETIDFEPSAAFDGGVFANTITQGQGVNNQTYGVIGASTDSSFSNVEYSIGTGTQTFISNPTVFFDLSTTWGNAESPSNADFSITGNVTIKGALTVISSSNIVNIQVSDFKTNDPFILLNSGSTGTSEAFQYSNGGVIVQTSNPAGGAHGSAIFYQSGSTHNVWGVTTSDQVGWNDIHPGTTNGDLSGTSLSGNTEAIIATVAISDVTDPNDSLTEHNVFWDSAGQERLGSWYVDTDADPAGGESNVWFYTA